jgi:hypothetical protein
VTAPRAGRRYVGVYGDPLKRLGEARRSWPGIDEEVDPAWAAGPWRRCVACGVRIAGVIGHNARPMRILFP